MKHITRTASALAAAVLLALVARGQEPTPTPSPTPFESYTCALGTVTSVDAGSYLIATPDGRTIGIAAASGDPSEANVEADIAAADTSNALASAKAAQLAEINAAKAAAIAEGVWTTGGDGLQHPLDIGESAQAEWIKALTALQNAQTVLGFDPATQSATDLLGPLLDKAGQPVGALTVTQFRGIMAALTAQIGALRAGYVGALQALDAATTPAEVEAVSLATPTPSRRHRRLNQQPTTDFETPPPRQARRCPRRPPRARDKFLRYVPSPSRPGCRA